MVEGDDDSWYREWAVTAQWVHDHGEAALAGGHLVSAHDAFLRAANYFRAAEFILHANPTDPRIRNAATLSECLGIPDDATTLPGYFFRANTDGPRPTVVVHIGLDGTAESSAAVGGQLESTRTPGPGTNTASWPSSHRMT